MSADPIEHRAKIAEARNVLGEVIARARFGGEVTVLVNRGKDAAAVVSMDFYERAKHNQHAIDSLGKAIKGLAPDDAHTFVLAWYEEMVSTRP